MCGGVGVLRGPIAPSMSELSLPLGFLSLKIAQPPAAARFALTCLQAAHTHNQKKVTPNTLTLPTKLQLATGADCECCKACNAKLAVLPAHARQQHTPIDPYNSRNITLLLRMGFGTLSAPILQVARGPTPAPPDHAPKHLQLAVPATHTTHNEQNTLLPSPAAETARAVSNCVAPEVVLLLSDCHTQILVCPIPSRYHCQPPHQPSPNQHPSVAELVNHLVGCFVLSGASEHVGQHTGGCPHSSTA